jgi:hypothetical protein
VDEIRKATSPDIASNRFFIIPATMESFYFKTLV